MDLNIKIFADGADLDDIQIMAANPMIKGFTTNPTLMRKAGVKNYEKFAREMLEIVPELPVSFELFADQDDEMYKQAKNIASWGRNVNVKIPITNTQGKSCASLIKKLSDEGVILNVTAIMTLAQVETVASALNVNVGGIVSVFAGRIADTGIDPIPLMSSAKDLLKNLPKAELLWASPRELLNIFHAEEAGVHIITATNDILHKLSSVGKDLDEFSRETVEMFYRDASVAGYTITV